MKKSILEQVLCSDLLTIILLLRFTKTAPPSIPPPPPGVKPTAAQVNLITL